MTDSTVVYTDLSDAESAGAFLGAQITAAFHGQVPDAVILFASPKYDYSKLLRAIDGACRPRNMVGCSSAGEFTTQAAGDGAACAVALRSPEMEFTASVARGLRSGRNAAAISLVSSFRGTAKHDYRFRSALILTDALAGDAEGLVDELTLATAGTYQFFGGGAGDDARFHETHVFCGTEAISDAAIALEILSNKPLGIGVRHGWQPVGPTLRVTEVDGPRLVSLNAAPAVEAFQTHAEATGQSLDPTDPLPFFLHNVLGIETGGGYKLRVPLGVNVDGSISCAAEIPTGARARIMTTGGAAAAQAATDAIQDALTQMNGEVPKVALFFDCAATRLRMGKEFGLELHAVESALGTAAYAGCNTYGQIARADGQFSGFHNCTAVVCVIPE